MAYALVTRTNNHWAYRLGAGIALLAGFVTAWGTMVHLSETERLVNLAYFGVHALGAAGAAWARGKAAGMSRTSFAMAAAVILAWFVTQVISAPANGLVWNRTAASASVALAFTASGLLFRLASRAA